MARLILHMEVKVLDIEITKTLCHRQIEKVGDILLLTDQIIELITSILLASGSTNTHSDCSQSFLLCYIWSHPRWGNSQYLAYE